MFSETTHTLDAEHIEVWVMWGVRMSAAV